MNPGRVASSSSKIDGFRATPPRTFLSGSRASAASASAGAAVLLATPRRTPPVPIARQRGQRLGRRRTVPRHHAAQVRVRVAGQRGQYLGRRTSIGRDGKPNR